MYLFNQILRVRSMDLESGSKQGCQEKWRHARAEERKVKHEYFAWRSRNSPEWHLLQYGSPYFSMAPRPEPAGKEPSQKVCLELLSLVVSGRFESCGESLRLRFQ
jgi:hypothetical protein